MLSVRHPISITTSVADPLATNLVATRRLDTSPDLLALHAQQPERYPVLLESSAGAPAMARFDILMAFPGDVLTLDDQWQLSGPGGKGRRPAGFLDAFDEWWSAEVRPAAEPAAAPFQGGWFLFLAYEMACEVEPSLALQAAKNCPIATAIRIPAAIVRDRSTGHCMAVAEHGREDLLQEMAFDVRRQMIRPRPDRDDHLSRPILRGSVREDDPALFLRAARKAQAYIEAGDVYQANISRQWRGRLARQATPWLLYERLRRANPAPFSGLARLDGLSILSSSPERLLRVCNGQIGTRPIAGTRPRDTGGEDVRRAELLANPKERAEHIMLIDLERNDLGRICLPGSVRVDELMTVESYAHVHHIVSNVSGQLRPGTRPGEMLRAVFPGGTITGCPKVRCIEIIHELEGRPRGAYTGAMGYVNHDGSCDFNILIRSITLQGDEFCLAAGSGIVADSIPEQEIEETRAKAKGLLLSVGAPI